MEVELQQKGASTSFSNLTIWHLVPLIVSVACHSLPKLSSEENESVLNVATFLVELFSFESMLRCSENQLNWLGVVEALAYVLYIFLNVSFELKNFRIQRQLLFQEKILFYLCNFNNLFPKLFRIPIKSLFWFIVIFTTSVRLQLIAHLSSLLSSQGFKVFISVYSFNSLNIF